MDFVPPVATSLLLLPSLLLLSSLLLEVARISVDFEFTILASVLMFYKRNVSDDGCLIISHFCLVIGLLEYQTSNYRISDSQTFILPSFTSLQHYCTVFEFGRRKRVTSRGLGVMGGGGGEGEKSANQSGKKLTANCWVLNFQALNR